MKSYSQFLKSINESSGKNYIDVFNEDKPFGPPAFLVHRKEIIPELQNLIDKKERGLIQKIVVFANTQRSERSQHFHPKSNMVSPAVLQRKVGKQGVQRVR